MRKLAFVLSVILLNKKKNCIVLFVVFRYMNELIILFVDIIIYYISYLLQF